MNVSKLPKLSPVIGTNALRATFVRRNAAFAAAFNCFKKKDYDRTIKIIESLITLNNLVYEEEEILGQDQGLYVILCKSYLYLNKHEEAAPYIDKALAHWGNDKDLMFLKGFLLEAEGKHDEADEYKYDACMASL